MLKPIYCAIGRMRRYSSGAFDVFKKLKDSTEPQTQQGARKPSDKVLKLVDEILNLTLIESADLCDLCQERLAGKTSSHYFDPSLGSRTPFPHPQGFFAGYPPPGMHAAAPVFPGAHTAGLPTQSAPPQDGNASESTTNNATPPPTQEKEPSVVKLVGFDQAKKIAVIKAVRAVTGLGLRESKELVESFPRVLVSDCKGDKAKEIAKQIQEAGGEVKLE